MTRLWRRLLALALSVTLCLGVLPGQALAVLADNSPAENQAILEQLRALWGDDATAEEALALLEQYGLVDEDGTIITDWSGKITLQAEPEPLDFAGALALDGGTVTVNGRACDAGELRQTLEAMEALGLLADGAPLADWQLAVDGVPVAPAELEAALAAAQAGPEETGTEEAAPAEEPEAGGGLLAAVGRFLGMGSAEAAGPEVTVAGAPVDANALVEVVSFLAEYGLLTDTGASADWAMTVPGQARRVTAEEVTALVEDGSLSPDAVVTVDGVPITVADLRTILDIEAELRRIQETYFPEGGVDLSVEEAEALYSLYSQLLADGGFQLYNTNAADGLTADDFPSGIDQTVTITASGADTAQMHSDYTVTVELNKAQPKEDVTFSWRAFDGSVTVDEASKAGGTITIPAEETKATFTVRVGGAADRLDYRGQGAFVVQIYNVKNALFADGADRKDSWTKAVRVQGEDGLNYYQTATKQAEAYSGNGLAVAVNVNGSGSYLKGDKDTLKLLAGTEKANDTEAFLNWSKPDSGYANTLHTVLGTAFTIVTNGLDAGEYELTYGYPSLRVSIPDAIYQDESIWNGAAYLREWNTPIVTYWVSTLNDTGDFSSTPTYVLDSDQWPDLIEIEEFGGGPVTTEPYEETLVLERLAGQLQLLRRLRNGAALLQRADNQALLIAAHRLLQAHAVRQGLLRRFRRLFLLVVKDIPRDVIELDHRAGAQVKGRLHRVSQLPHVAGPVVGQQGVAHQLADPCDRPLHFPVVPLHIEVGKQRNVLRPLPQGRQGQLYHPQPVKQIPPEQSVPHGGDGIHVHGGDDAHIAVHVLLSAHGPELLLLDGLQNLGLEGEIHGVDLVQKEGATIGLLEQALPVFRAGIAPPGGAEQRALQQGGGNGRAVLGDEGALGSGAVAVEGLGKELLARAGLPPDQHRRGVGGHPLHGVLQGQHLRIPGDDVLQAEQARVGIGQPVVLPVQLGVLVIEH